MRKLSTLLFVVSFGCGKKKMEVANASQVEDMGSGKSRLDTVQFQGVKIEPNMQEESLEQTEEQVKKDIYNGVEQYWETVGEISQLVTIYSDFIRYEYGEDDERNTLYLTEDKKEVFHQLTGSAYDIVVAERNYYEVSGGIYIAGSTELRYAEMWNRYPTPIDLDHNSQIVFGETVRETVLHLTEEGKDKLERLISHYEKSRVSGDFTELALQELQWRFPLDYPAPVSAMDSSPLAVFAEYREVFSLPTFTKPIVWSAVYEEQMMEIKRLTDGQMVVDTIRLSCVDELKEFSLLGYAPVDLCVLRHLALQDILYVRYPGAKYPKGFQVAQNLVFTALKEHVEKIHDWEDSEYGRFWKKEASLMLRSLQYEKLSALRKNRRDGNVVQVDYSLWAFQPEELMEPSTETILDAHLSHLEREFRALIYDTNDLESMNRGAQMRQLFILLPQRLQELEMETQACLFAFPEHHPTRIRLVLLLIDSYSHISHTLLDYQTEQNASAIQRWNEMIHPFVQDLATLLEQQELSELQTEQFNEAMVRITNAIE